MIRYSFNERIRLRPEDFGYLIGSPYESIALSEEGYKALQILTEEGFNSAVEYISKTNSLDVSDAKEEFKQIVNTLVKMKILVKSQ